MRESTRADEEVLGLLKALTDAGWSRDQIARRMGKSVRTVENWLSGTTAPPRFTMQELKEIVKQEVGESEEDPLANATDAEMRREIIGAAHLLGGDELAYLRAEAMKRVALSVALGPWAHEARREMERLARMRVSRNSGESG